MSGVPVCCGALGSFDAGVVARIAALLDPVPREVYRDATSILFAARQPARWESGDAWGLAWSEREPDRSDQASSWQEAAAAGANGLWGVGEERGLHSSGAGVAPLYWLRDGEAVYFATRVDALARAGLASMSVDWEAWASILAVSFAQDGHTPFAEIRKLPPRAELRVRGSSVEITDLGLAWVEAEPLSLDEAAERVAAGLRADVADLDPGEPVITPLSAGWDSRVIANVLAERDMIAGAYTVDMDVGNDLELRLAAGVAAELGVEQTVVDPELPPFEAELRHAAERVEYQSLPHLFIHRLAGGLPGGGICADGFGGNILKGRGLHPEILGSANPLAATFATLASESEPIYGPSSWGAVHGAARTAFLRENDRYAGFRASPSPAIYNRARHAIGSLGVTALGRHNRLFMPIVSDAVATAAWGAPPADRASKRLYPRVFALLKPDLGRLPSTNDTPKPGRAWRPHFRKRDARAAHRSLLARSPLRPWFSAQLESAVEERGIARFDARPRSVRRLQAAIMFGLWTERYGDLVGEVDPAEMLGKPRT